MAYIGKSPQVGNFVKLDAITTSSTNTYNLLNGGVAFTPESANHMIVSLNGVIQAPNTAFSVSGSTITFLPSSGTLSSADSIDFIMVLGNVLDIGTPSDSTVTNAKTNFTTTSSNAGLQIKGDGTTAGAIQLNCEQNSHGIKLQSPAHSSNQSYTLKFPTGNVTAGKVLKVDSVSGSGTTGVGQLSFGDGGGLVQLLDVTLGSAVAYYDIDSTYINSTYDDYFCIFSFKDSVDNEDFRVQVFVGGTRQTGHIYGFEIGAMGSSSYEGSNANPTGKFNVSNIGSATGEGISGHFYMHNVNNTNLPWTLMGQATVSTTSGSPFANHFSTHLIPANAGDVVNGIRLYFDSGNITSGSTLKLYGIV
tara:strand:+ start:880 stop:1965 length:1086 start_codon:yes stop_codon:yes gene_type:complete